MDPATIYLTMVVLLAIGAAFLISTGQRQASDLDAARARIAALETERDRLRELNRQYREELTAVLREVPSAKPPVLPDLIWPENRRYRGEGR